VRTNRWETHFITGQLAQPQMSYVIPFLVQIGQNFV
jgi:hypothetical protein